MLKYSVSQSSGDNFLVTILEEGKYKGVICNIVDLKFEQDGTLDFEIELPKNKVELFEDEEFKEEISVIVGDVFKKAVEGIYNTQDQMTKIEEHITKKLEENNIQKNNDRMIIEQFMEKGFLLKIDKTEDGKEKYVAVDIKTNIPYDMDAEPDFEKVTSVVFRKDIVLN